MPQLPPPTFGKKKEKGYEQKKERIMNWLVCFLHLMNILSVWPLLILYVTALIPLSRQRVPAPKNDETENYDDMNQAIPRTVLESPPKSNTDELENEMPQTGHNKSNYSARSLLKSASISGSKCIGVQSRKDPEV